MYNILNNITKTDIFYSIIIISCILLIINKFHLSINSLIYIIIISLLLLLYKYYNIEQLKLSNNKLNTFNLDVDINKYNNIFVILNNIYKYEKFNEYAFSVAIYYIKLFINNNTTNSNKLYYINQILNNLSSMIIATPLEYHNNIQININKLKHELELYVKKNTNIQTIKYNKYFELY